MVLFRQGMPRAEADHRFDISAQALSGDGRGRIVLRGQRCGKEGEREEIATHAHRVGAHGSKLKLSRCLLSARAQLARVGIAPQMITTR